MKKGRGIRGLFWMKLRGERASGVVAEGFQRDGLLHDEAARPEVRDVRRRDCKRSENIVCIVREYACALQVPTSDALPTMTLLNNASSICAISAPFSKPCGG